MKKYNLLYILLPVTLLFASCSDFLNMTPKDKKVVKTVQDHKDILASYMFFLKNFNRAQIPIMGVDPWAFPNFNVSTIFSVRTGESFLNREFSFLYDSRSNKYKEDALKKILWLDSQDEIWDRYYSFVGPINMLIKDIETAENNDNSMKNYVKGEALAWRAFTYYKLLQYYSPYKDNSLGIPIVLDPSDDIGNMMPPRKTQTEVFSQILSDCNEALKLLSVTPTTEWNYIYREDFIHAMLASVYMWKAESGAATNDDWSNAYKNADAAIGERKLSDEADFKAIFDCSKEHLQDYVQNSEYYIRIVDNSNLIMNSDAYRKNYVGSSIVDGVANLDYYALFTDNDIRKNIYFTKGADDQIVNNKYNVVDVDLGEISGGCFMPFRLAEMYLIKAEADAKTGNIAGANATLNIFKAHRYKDYVNTDITDKEKLVQEIYLERFKEFYAENDMMWLDFKRQGRSLERTVNGEKNVIEANDFRYTLPIPLREMKENKSMQQAPGWKQYL